MNSLQKATLERRLRAAYAQDIVDMVRAKILDSISAFEEEGKGGEHDPWDEGVNGVAWLENELDDPLNEMLIPLLVPNRFQTVSQVQQFLATLPSNLLLQLMNGLVEDEEGEDEKGEDQYAEQFSFSD
jgi:hypothetical protein